MPTLRDPSGAVIVSRSGIPILAPSVNWTENRKEHQLVITGGLHSIRGNSAPYFSITATEYVNGRDESSGCLHELILSHRPEFADLVALHLSNIAGAPMHTEANGFYWLAGAVGGLGEQYHGGNGNPARSEAECLDVFARHIRVPIDQAQEMAESIAAVYRAELEQSGPDSFAAAPGFTAVGAAQKAARKAWAEIALTFRERWAREARECIKRHGLVIWGDGGIREAISG